MHKSLFCIAAIILAGCATTPQTREEFKAWTKDHTTMGLYDTYAVSRRFEDVVASLQDKWQQCYNLNVTTTRASGGMTTSRYRDTFHPQSRKVSNALTEMTLQMTTQGMVMLNKIPEGGEYNVALDVQRTPQNKAKLTWYSYVPGGWRDAWELNKQWADGKDAPCQ
jgi:hypothetical protein